MSKRYIDADLLLNKLPDDLPYKSSVKRVLIQAPTADVVEVRHGEWEKVMNHRECSKCSYNAPYKKIKAGYHLQDLSKYCPNCGAKMDGERKEQ